jgi:drug/metabolite transporter (DMT)-like permease
MVAAVGATRAISIEFVVTVIAVSIGALILHERLSILQLIGGAVIILGCSLVLDLIPRMRTN